MENGAAQNFDWTVFYAEFADKLLQYKNNRAELLTLLELAHRQAGLRYPFMDAGQPLDDICPFTVFGAFNKGITTGNRVALMKALAARLGVEAAVPSEFDGVPVLNNIRAWFFAYKKDRQPNDIDNLWGLFEAALHLADKPSSDNRQTFISFYNRAAKQLGVKWNITMGLYWVRPYYYVNLDGRNRQFLIDGKEAAPIEAKKVSNLKQLPDAQTYLALIDKCQKSFSSAQIDFHNFPELSYAAWVSTKDNEVDPDISKASFLEWFAPLIDALKELGGSASPEEVRKQIAIDLELSPELLNETRGKTGTKKFDNDVAWARNYLAYEGIIDKERRGIWALTEKGNTVTMTKELASAIFFKWVDVLKGRRAKVQVDETEKNEQKENMFQDYAPGENTQKYEEYTDIDFLSEVFIEPYQYELLVTLLKLKKNIILQGAPGVGKTFAAKRLAYSIIGAKDTSRVMMVQFHQSYSYEDFIMGFRPTQNGFELAAGPFYQFCKKAQDDQEHEYFFIIDEINRGNLSKIFGELLMLIENDKRGEKLRLLYSNELFSVPKNVYIVGLMNTADRSLAMIDYALRRRFAFYEMEPAFDSDGFQTMVQSSNNQKFAALVDCVKELNNTISQDESLGDGFRIGHSYFCADCEVTDEWLSSIVEFELIPLLNEYWFDEKSKIENWVYKLRGALND